MNKLDPLEEVRNDPDFEEFYRLQRNVAQDRRVWADDAPLATIESKKSLPDSEKRKLNRSIITGDDGDDGDDDNDVVEPKENQNQTSDDKVVDKPKKKRKRAPKKKKCKPKEFFPHTIKLKGFAPESKKRDIKDFLAPLKTISLRLDKRDQIAHVAFHTEREMKIALKKDQHFHGLNRIKVVKCNIEKSRLSKEYRREKKEHKQIERDERLKKYEQTVKEAEPVEESGRIFVRNLSYTCTTEDLEEKFSPYGQLAEVHLSIDDFTKMPKGFAFVEFVFPKNASKAFEDLNGTDFQGRKLHLIPAKAQPDPAPKPYEKSTSDSGGSSFKTQKAEELKQKAGDSHNWNILFLGQNAVADVMAEREQVDKTDLLTKQSKRDPIAVRMALGDAMIVEETRKFLISQGVELDSFSKPQAPRSKTVIIAKNLPARTQKDELLNMFSNYGAVSRVIMPPNGLTAIIEMQEPTEAKKAFKNLAYSKFKSSLFYLEWAPVNVFMQKSLDDQEKQELDEMSKLQTGTKIVVKNVPFEATHSELTKIFKKFGELSFVRFVKKADGQHRGFAFVDFCTKDDALRAFRALCHSTHLYGRKLILEWAKVNDVQ